jgi:hypothetical protein
MASIETAIRAMLVNGTTLSTAGIPDARVFHGYRLQDTILPACTFEVQQTQVATIGSSPLRQADVSVTIIASTTAAALGFLSALRTLCVAGTYDTIEMQAAVENGHAVEPGSVGEGDEAEPAQLTYTFTATYKE